MKRYIVLTMLLVASMLVVASAQQTAEQHTQVPKFAIGGFPYYGAVVTPDDGADVAVRGYVRANADGAVTAACMGNGADNQITLTLVAGEFFPCLVSRVYDTGTDAIVLHIFY